MFGQCVRLMMLNRYRFDFISIVDKMYRQLNQLVTHCMFIKKNMNSFPYFFMVVTRGSTTTMLFLPPLQFEGSGWYQAGHVMPLVDGHKASKLQDTLIMLVIYDAMLWHRWCLPLNIRTIWWKRTTKNKKQSMIK